MSIKVSLSTLDEKLRNKIVKDLQFYKKETKFNKFAPKVCIYPYDVEGDSIYLPMNYCLKNLKGFCKRKERKDFTNISPNFTLTLREMQKEVGKEAISQMNTTGSCVISMYTGAGKTFTSIYLACMIRFKTLIIISRLVLIEQWKESITKTCPNSKVQVLTPKTKMDENADFYIMNAVNVPKRERDFFKDIGTLIVDEVHLIATESLSRCLCYINPRYSMGLSATPYRSDGMDILLDIYFGKDRIIRKLNKKHFVYKVNTEFSPSFDLGRNGRVDWNSVIESQCNDEERNQKIIKIIRYFSNRVFLVLCKRVKQANYLVDKLKELGEDVTSLIGVQKFCNYDSRILIATIQKAGVGFDHPKLNSLILASDVEEYFIQYLGRVMRTEEVEPFIFDLVDENPILKKHYYTRRKVYLEHGGIIKDFKNFFPDF